MKGRDSVRSRLTNQHGFKTPEPRPRRRCSAHRGPAARRDLSRSAVQRGDTSPWDHAPSAGTAALSGASWRLRGRPSGPQPEGTLDGGRSHIRIGCRSQPYECWCPLAPTSPAPSHRQQCEQSPSSCHRARKSGAQASAGNSGSSLGHPHPARNHPPSQHSGNDPLSDPPGPPAHTSSRSSPRPSARRSSSDFRLAIGSSRITRAASWRRNSSPYAAATAFPSRK